MTSGEPGRQDYRRWGEVCVRPEAAAGLRGVDTVLFDIDGVLLDVTNSLHQVGCRAVRFYLTRLLGWPDDGPVLEPPELRLFKVIPGFNDDWDLAYTMVLLNLVKAQLTGRREASRLREASPTYAEFAAELAADGGGFQPAVTRLLDRLDEAGRAEVLAQWDRPTILQVFQEHYAGRRYCRPFYGYDPKYVDLPVGFIRNDRPLLDRQRLPARTRLGIYSGRTWEETKAALELAGWSDLFRREHIIVVDDGPKKPDPAGLVILARRLGSRSAVYIGDMPDDRNAVRNYRALPEPLPPMFDVLVRTGPLREQPLETALAQGADVVAPDVNAFLDWRNGAAEETPPGGDP